MTNIVFELPAFIATKSKACTVVSLYPDIGLIVITEIFKALKRGWLVTEIDGGKGIDEH